jgi:hypothetical protein
MPHSSLGRRIGKSPTDPETLEAMRRKAWVEQGVVTLKPGELLCDWLKQALVNEAESRWGKRRVEG